MCTLTYLPNSNGGFILTSNRDEKVDRKVTLPPEHYYHYGVKVVYPKDTQGGGTWLAAAENGFTLCLLNGAFDKHIPAPPYRKSRGLVLLDFFEYNQVGQFLKNYDFTGIEPFTLIIIEKQLSVVLHQLRWDGLTVHHSLLNEHEPHIWSSATLYAAETIAERELWFKEWLTINPEPTIHDMLYFHHFGGKGDQHNDLLMNRGNRLKTLSISSFKHCVDGYFMLYEDLQAHTHFAKEINELTTAL